MRASDLLMLLDMVSSNIRSHIALISSRLCWKGFTLGLRSDLVGGDISVQMSSCEAERTFRISYILLCVAFSGTAWGDYILVQLGCCWSNSSCLVGSCLGSSIRSSGTTSISSIFEISGEGTGSSWLTSPKSSSSSLMRRSLRVCSTVYLTTAGWYK